MSFILIILFFMILFAPGIIIVATPVGWVRLTSSLIVLGLGLLWLDEHVATVAPYDDDGPFHGIGGGIVMIMAIATGIGITVRGYVLLQNDPDEPRHPVDRAWPIPLGVLAAALFLHWLSNRLAGAQPPWAIHVGLIMLGFVLTIAFAFFAVWAARVRSPSLLVAAFAFSFAGMVINDAAKGADLWKRAKEEAGARPHCIMTYGGWQHRRIAKDSWDLSPLVNRHYATWAAGKSPVLIVRNEEGVRQLRWRGHFQEGSLGPAPCEPR